VLQPNRSRGDLAVSDQFVGEIRLFPFNFAPVGWALCQGQLLPISQNTALFSLLGTMYGGNGTSNFALPDLRGRLSLSFGQGPGLTLRTQGTIGGEESIALTAPTMPAHTHVLTAGGTLYAKNAAGDSQSPVGTIPAQESSGATATYSSATPDASMRAGGVVFGGQATASTTGSGIGHENRQPYLTLNYCIALSGVFPSRS
jgi:microcystin-dependent protein